MKTSELQGASLDWAVAKCEGLKVRVISGVCHDVELLDMQVDGDTRIIYSTDWAQGGTIIEREGISLKRVADALWEATIMGEWTEDGPTPLIAAMRCYAGSQLGNEIEIPEELTGVAA